MVHNGDDKCSRKIDSHDVEDKTTSEVPATEHPRLADKTAAKKVNETNTVDESKELITVMKRIAELEEKMAYINNQPPTTPHGEEMLNVAVSRAHVLEQELQATKKALEESLAKQEHLSAYMEKMKKKKWFPW